MSSNAINQSAPGLIGWNGSGFDSTAVTNRSVLTGGTTSSTLGSGILPGA